MTPILAMCVCVCVCNAMYFTDRKVEEKNSGLQFLFIFYFLTFTFQVSAIGRAVIHFRIPSNPMSLPWPSWFKPTNVRIYMLQILTLFGQSLNSDHFLLTLLILR